MVNISEWVHIFERVYVSCSGQGGSPESSPRYRGEKWVRTSLRARTALLNFPAIWRWSGWWMVRIDGLV